MKMESINDLSVGKLIGKGGFGKVYLGTTKDGSGRRFAIKVMRKDWLREKKLINRVEQEIELHRSLRDHPNIVKLYTFFEDQSNLYLILELCEQGNLYQYLKKHRPLQLDLVKKWFTDVVKGLEYLHRHDIVHRDLKLSNILIGNDGHAKISDFGMAALIEDREHHTVCGTPNYMAPEVKYHVKGGDAYNPVQADMWSLGCLLYTMLNNGKHVDENKGYEKTKHVPDDAHEVLSMLLRHQDRSTTAELLDHPFLGPRKVKQTNPQEEEAERISYVEIDPGNIRGVQHKFGEHVVQILRDGRVQVSRGPKKLIVSSRMPSRYAKVQQFCAKALVILKANTPKVVLKLNKPEPIIAAVINGAGRVWFETRNLHATYDLNDQEQPEEDDYAEGPKIQFNNESMDEEEYLTLSMLVQDTILRCLEIENNIHATQHATQPVHFPIILNNDQVILQNVGTGVRTSDGDVNICLYDGTSLTLDKTASVVTFEQSSYLLTQPLPTNLKHKLKQAQQVIGHLINNC